MGESKKSKSLKWSSDGNLCQIRLFSPEDPPSEVNLGGSESEDDVPPGFERIQKPILRRNKLSQIPLIKWRCPPRFVIDIAWKVAAGEESKELETQNLRQTSVHKAIYRRPKPAPPDLSNVEDTSEDDLNVPLIPLTPIEDQDEELDSSSVDPKAASLGNAPNNPHVQMPATVTESDVVAAAEAAMAAITSNVSLKDLIDNNWLVKLMSGEILFERLVMNHGAATPVVQNLSSSSSSSCLQNIQPICSQSMPSLNRALMPSFSFLTSPFPPSMPNWRYQANSFNNTAPFIASGQNPAPARPILGSYPIPSFRWPTPSPWPWGPRFLSLGAPITNSVSYYHNPIYQHGGTRPQELTNPTNEKPKVMKSCIYFMSPMGCRNGVNCAFLHDTQSQQSLSNSIPDIQSPKRMKMD